LGGAGLVTPLVNLAVAAALLGQLVSQAGELRRAWPEIRPAVAQQVEHENDLLAERELSLDGLPETGDPLPLDCTGSSSSAGLPDIYYIILDAYGREDVLSGLYGVDNRSILTFLEEKGFFIARESHTNFIQTVFSIPAALNFTYLTPEPEGANGAAYFSRLISENSLFKSLERCGYQTVVFNTGFYFTNHIEADLVLTSGSGLSEFEDLLLAGSPVDLLAGGLFSHVPELSYPAHRRRVLFTFEQLQQLPRLPGPKIVFAHIVSPHPPFVFDAQGRAIEPDREYSIEDGDEFDGEWAEYRQGYAGQVQFVNRMLERTIRLILARSASPPVIVVQGDHGPGGSLDWESPANTCLWERTSILNAYYLPGVDTGQLSPSLSPVNTFRVILNAYFGAGLELLPDYTFFTSHRLPREVNDITGRRDSKENCP
jgi:hypothetical protein